MFSTRIFKSIIAIILLLTITCSLFACNAAKPSEKSFEKAYDGMIDDVIDGLDDYYKRLDSYDPTNGAVNANISVDLSDELLNLIRSMTAEDFSWLNGLNIGYSQSWKDNKAEIGLGLDYEKKELVTAKIIADIAGGNTYLLVPALAKKYLVLGSEDVDLSELGSAMSLDNGGYFPEKAVLERVIRKYYGMIMAGIGEVSFSETALTVNGISQECVEYVSELTEKEIADLAASVLENVKTDEDIKAIIMGAAENTYDTDMTPEETYNAFIEEVDYAISDVKEAIANGEVTDKTALIFTSYITAKLDVIGMKAEMFDEETNTVIAAVSAELDGAKGTQIYLDEDGVRYFEVIGKTEEADGLLSGTYELLVEGKSMCFVDLDNIDTNKLEKGYFNGSLSISPSKGFIDMITEDSAGSGLPVADLGIASISLKFDFLQDSDDAAKLTMSIMNSGMPYASVIVDVCVSDGKEVSVPDTANTESDPEVWLEGVSFDGLLKNVSESGLPEYVVELVEYYLSALQ